ncbi:sensor histidine kinase [Acidiferrimicrobium sp. IK]|uniref:sensor histidine kinase n=1 Tax=Acidiferrimicrobium sp. IK TaxID=2871700 RepID=UPI0021CB6479|nr:sensor histidine kinase [Acidiferrimicrobium sp. IK]MCU4185817.1 sensor histidine kinase [Acidiferrimicrobium sp. IK]
MATLAELVREHTKLEQPVTAHLQRLVGSWGTLSDLCFADLLLFVPVDGSDDRFVVVGQVRPTTNQTLHLEDLVGRVMGVDDRPLLARAWQLGSVVEGEVSIPSRNERGRQVVIPVRWQDELVALMTRESALSVGRRPGELERVYVEVFDRLARMIAAGEFPFPIDEVVTSEMPRVGDGVLVLDASARVDYASPNAVNALHRLGIYSGIEGVSLDEAGLDQSAVKVAFATRLPATEEVTEGSDSMVFRCVPLLDKGNITGALVLLRDVSELRRRDRLLLSKDAAIREVHHRVKNNLQTISSLLRLQSRRLPQGEARHALEESERRVRSIALVHEILSRDTTDEVDFNDILPSLVRMAEDLGSSDRPVHITTTGETGELQAALATPLAVVITELLQNAAEHAFPEGSTVDIKTIRVTVDLERTPTSLRVTVRDNGVGLPPGFVIEDTASLGLSIVRSLVGSQLGGTINMRTDGGTIVELVIPVDNSPEDLEKL